jgi:hypothetical protein
VPLDIPELEFVPIDDLLSEVCLSGSVHVTWSLVGFYLDILLLLFP